MRIGGALPGRPCDPRGVAKAHSLQVVWELCFHSASTLHTFLDFHQDHDLDVKISGSRLLTALAWLCARTREPPTKPPSPQQPRHPPKGRPSSPSHRGRPPRVHAAGSCALTGLWRHALNTLARATPRRGRPSTRYRCRSPPQPHSLPPSRPRPPESRRPPPLELALPPPHPRPCRAAVAVAIAANTASSAAQSTLFKVCCTSSLLLMQKYGNLPLSVYDGMETIEKPASCGRRPREAINVFLVPHHAHIVVPLVHLVVVAIQRADAQVVKYSATP